MCHVLHVKKSKSPSGRALRPGSGEDPPSAGRRSRVGERTAPYPLGMETEASTANTRPAAREILTDPLVGPIIVIVFILLAGLGLVFPVLPLFARSFGVGNDGAGLFIGAFGFA